MKNLALLVIHPTRPDAREFGAQLLEALKLENYEVYTNNTTLLKNAKDISSLEDISTLDIAIVLGGDGTILRGAELIYGTSVPLIGINMGSVGFLAEISKPSLESLISAIKQKRVNSEPRLVLNYQIIRNEKEMFSGWALNEVGIVRSNSQMIELFVQIDNRPLSRWGCDGVICATPTGSTAYAFSAGGPVVWPEVNAIVLMPLAAHALFAKPMVISPDSEIVIDLESETAEIAADGMRKTPLMRGDRVIISKDKNPIFLSHIDKSDFTDRLVAKFKLPVEGWRG